MSLSRFRNSSMAESIYKGIKKSHNVHVPGTFIAPQPMLLMKSTGLVMLGAVGNLDAVFAQRIFPQDSAT